MLHGLCFGEEGGARNLVFFRVKWLQPAMKGTSCVWRLRLRSFRTRLVPPLCSATSGCSCVRSSIRFLKLWLQIALEWLHECCMGFVLGRKAGRKSTKPCIFPCKVAASGDERYRRVCGGCGCGRSRRDWFLLCVLQRVVVPVCVVLCVS